MPAAPTRTRCLRCGADVAISDTRCPSCRDDLLRYPGVFHPRCLACKYDLAGLDVRDCPECGARAELHYLLWAHQNELYSKAERRKSRVDAVVVILVGCAAFSMLLTLGAASTAISAAMAASILTLAALWLCAYGLDTRRWRPAICLAPAVGTILALSFTAMGPADQAFPSLALLPATPFTAAALRFDAVRTIMFLSAFLSALLLMVALHWLVPAVNGLWHGAAYTGVDRPWDPDARPTLLTPSQALRLGLMTLALHVASTVVAILALRRLSPRVRRLR